MPINAVVQKASLISHSNNNKKNPSPERLVIKAFLQDKKNTADSAKLIIHNKLITKDSNPLLQNSRWLLSTFLSRDRKKVLSISWKRAKGQSFSTCYLFQTELQGQYPENLCDISINVINNHFAHSVVFFCKNSLQEELMLHFFREKQCTVIAIY